MTILSFKCKDTEALFKGLRVRHWVNVERRALRKLAQQDWSLRQDDLCVPPGKQLEARRGDRRGQHNIRINEQWRACFVWMHIGISAPPQGPTTRPGPSKTGNLRQQDRGKGAHSGRLATPQGLVWP